MWFMILKGKVIYQYSVSSYLGEKELNELEDSMGNVDRGLSQRRISKLPTYKYGAETKTCCWQIRKKKFIATDTQ